MTAKPWYLVRSERYKLVADAETGIPCMLFDLENDPEESRNLVLEEAYGPILSELERKLAGEVGNYHYSY